MQLNVGGVALVSPVRAGLVGVRIMEDIMSFGEKLYLGMVVGVFVSFGVLMVSLCWLDSIEDRAQPHRNPKPLSRRSKSQETVSAGR
jgi:hypothetical protein